MAQGGMVKIKKFEMCCSTRLPLFHLIMRPLSPKMREILRLFRGLSSLNNFFHIIFISIFLVLLDRKTLM